MQKGRRLVVVFQIVWWLGGGTLAAAEGQRWGLMVGVGHYSQLEEKQNQAIQGCDGDADYLADMMRNDFQFALVPDNKPLKNEKATLERLRQAMKELSSRVHPEDAVLFYFSGPGSRIPDQNGDEPDGYDETLCLFDAHPENGDQDLRDDELAAWVESLPTDNVTVVLDCGFSGGAAGPEGNYFPKAIRKSPRSESTPGKEGFTLPQGVLVTAGPVEGQAYQNTEMRGALTAQFFNILKRCPPDWTYAELRTALRGSSPPGPLDPPQDFRVQGWPQEALKRALFTSQSPELLPRALPPPAGVGTKEYDPPPFPDHLRLALVDPEELFDPDRIKWMQEELQRDWEEFAEFVPREEASFVVRFYREADKVQVQVENGYGKPVVGPYPYQGLFDLKKIGK